MLPVTFCTVGYDAARMINENIEYISHYSTVVQTLNRTEFLVFSCRNILYFQGSVLGPMAHTVHYVHCRLDLSD